MVDMERSLLKKLCRDHDLYVTPSINDKLYLHYKGFRRIQNLDEYTGLKVLWLEGNGLARIEGLERQTQLRTLYLQENLIRKIENLEAQTALDTLNLAQNQVAVIENLSHMKALTSLSLKGNYLATAADVRHVLELPSLAVLDIQGNRIDDPDVVDVLAQMPSLKVLYLQGNDVVKKVKQYRKTLIYRCRQLKYLDDRPVFDDERRRVDAWGRALDESGGDLKAAQEAEREELDAIRREKKERDDRNFQLFEQMMIEGRRKRQEDEERKKSKESDGSPELRPDGNNGEDEVNPFSGERIVPVQDCAFLQQAREKRWAAVVDAPDTLTRPVGAAAGRENNQEEVEGSEQRVGGDSGVIPVDTRRLEVLHQCATVGAGTPSSRDPFVDAAFQVVAPEPPLAIGGGGASGETDVLLPPSPTPTAHAELIKEKARAKVQALKSAMAVDAAASTTLVTPPPAPRSAAVTSAAAASDMTRAPPPPEPVAHPSASASTSEPGPGVHTNVDELD